MTQSDFARHFLTACNTLGVWEYDEPGANADELDVAAAKVWKLWLIPSLFDGFDPAAWLLSAAEQVRAREEVRQYLAAAERVHTTGIAPTAADVTPARVAFQQVYRALSRSVFTAHQLSPATVAMLRDCRRIVLDASDTAARRWAVSADLVLGFNWDEEPSLDVWVVIPDEAADDDDFWADWQPWRARVQQKLYDRVEEDRFVYLSLRTVGEVLERITGVPA
jgi:hypothetical protein